MKGKVKKIKKQPHSSITRDSYPFHPTKGNPFAFIRLVCLSFFDDDDDDEEFEFEFKIAEVHSFVQLFFFSSSINVPPFNLMKFNFKGLFDCPFLFLFLFLSNFYLTFISAVVSLLILIITQQRVNPVKFRKSKSIRKQVKVPKCYAITLLEHFRCNTLWS